MGSIYLYLSNFLYLTRISHELSAAAPDPSASAAFRFVGLLDDRPKRTSVSKKYASGALPARARA